MPILAAVREREPSRIAEPTRRAVNHLSDERQRGDGARAHARLQQELGEVRGAAVGCSRERRVQPAQEDIARAHLVMRRQLQVWQRALWLWLRKQALPAR
jgi:hypothetical protein